MRLLFAAACLALLLPHSAGAQSPLPGTQVAQRYQHPDDAEARINYLLWLPREYGTTKQTWPVLVFLHGSGERGRNLALVQKHGPPKLADAKDLPFIVVSPQCPKEIRWDDPHVFKALQGMLDDVVRQYSVDAKKVYLTGLSMGGFGSWFWASQEPYRFAAVAPICGGGEPAWGASLSHLPIWVFHGAQDKGVPLERSEEMVAAIKEAGGEPKFTVYPEAGHDSWTESYNNPELYAWLLTHERQEPPQEEQPVEAPKPEPAKKDMDSGGN